MYRERPSTLDGVVAWTNEPDGSAWVLPDGCMDLVWDGTTLSVAGPDTTAKCVDAPPARRFVGLRFAPGVAPGVIGHPAHVLRDQRVPLDELWGERAVRPLIDQVGGAHDALASLEAVAARYVAHAPPQDRALAAVVRRLRRGDTVAAAAASVGLSERQLHRRALVAFGYGPKMLARVLRLQRALELARAGVGFAFVAAETGYADQAHLARDVRALAGSTLGDLVS